MSCDGQTMIWQLTQLWTKHWHNLFHSMQCQMASHGGGYMIQKGDGNGYNLTFELAQVGCKCNSCCCSSTAYSQRALLKNNISTHNSLLEYIKWLKKWNNVLSRLALSRKRWDRHFSKQTCRMPWLCHQNVQRLKSCHPAIDSLAL